MPLTVQCSAEGCIRAAHRPAGPFGNLSADGLQYLDKIAERVILPGRAIVFCEDEPSTTVFVVCEGQLMLFTVSREGRRMIVRIAGPGDILGLSAALNDAPYEVTAETLEPAKLKRINRADFLDLFHRYSEVSQKTTELLAREYREVFMDARRLARSGLAHARLARLLLEWPKRSAGRRPDAGPAVSLTHEALGDMAGISRETVTRLLSQFEREKLIERRGRSVIILDPDKLEILAE